MNYYTKNYLRAFLFLGLAMFGICPAQADTIDAYDVDIRLEKDSTLTVRETIIYDFGQTPNRHGIVYDLPLFFSRDKDERRFEISDVMVDDGAGLLHQYQEKKGANYLNLRIGDKDATVEGKQKYVVSYRVANAIFDDGDDLKLYWTAINSSWQAPVQQARVVFHLPAPADASRVLAKCELGQRGSGQDCYSRAVNNEAGQVESLVFMNSDPLPSGRGLFVNIGLPDAGLAQKDWKQILIEWKLPIGLAVLGLFVVAVVVISVKKKRRSL